MKGEFSGEIGIIVVLMNCIGKFIVKKGLYDGYNVFKEFFD